MGKVFSSILLVVEIKALLLLFFKVFVKVKIISQSWMTDLDSSTTAEA